MDITFRDIPLALLVALGIPGMGAAQQAPTRPEPPAASGKQAPGKIGLNEIWAKKVAELSLAHPRAAQTWGKVRAALMENEKYAKCKVTLEERNIIGLVPIGENPVTKLWEFYDLRSAWDGASDPREIAIPEHRPDGTVDVGDDTGIVFVLLPGGSFRMGAQSTKKDAPCFDERAFDRESPVKTITLAPFFLARHELTQGQWARLSKSGDFPEAPSQFKVGLSFGGKAVRWANPVESVDWPTCTALLKQHGLVLPTEAQWEYGCRAGTSTPWWPGSEPEDLAGKENVRDKTGDKAVQPPAQPFPFDDGFTVTSPVGTFPANTFGLHDMHGNVREWCQDEDGPYSAPTRAGDGLRLPVKKSRFRCYRGGAFGCDLPLTRSAYRPFNVPATVMNWLGVRPVRALER